MHEQNFRCVCGFEVGSVDEAPDAHKCQDQNSDAQNPHESWGGPVTSLHFRT